MIFLSSSNKTLKLLVANYDGIVSVYEVNTTEGGECRQISQYLLFNISQNPKNSHIPTNSTGRRSSGKFIDHKPYLKSIFLFD